MNTQTASAGEQKPVVVAGQRAAFRQMTVDQLLNLGVSQVIYARSASRQGAQVWRLYGANGATLTEVDTVDAALETAAGLGLRFVTLH